MEHIKDYKLFKESLDNELLTEKFSSDILRQFTAQDNDSKWRGGIAKDMQKFASLALDKISDADFTITTPEAYWKGGDAKNPNKVGFFVDADPGFIKWAKANKKYMPGGLSLGNISKYGLVLSVIRGGIGMYYGFSMDKGSSYSRHRKGTEERYGVLAKDYETRTVYQGWEGAPAAKVTRKNLIDAATRVYVLDLDSLRDKYNVKGLTNDRANSKRGATALKDAKSIKDQNRKRYDAILADRAAMTDIDRSVKDSIELLNQHIMDALKYGNTDKFGNLVIGEDPRGRSLKITDGANYIKNLLDDYQRYKDYERQQKEAEAEGRGADNYYTTEVKNYAKRIQDRAKAVKAKNYAW
jgi:hypothetical protein|tara:strand:+ start:127 stop:1188 length:1062 start_codon:yes stop_codon:yes gene_type:complete